MLPQVDSPALRLEVLVEHVALVMASGRYGQARSMLENGALLAEGIKSQLFQLRLQLLWIELKHQSGDLEEAIALLEPFLVRCRDQGLLRLARQALRIGLRIHRRAEKALVDPMALDLLDAARRAGSRADAAVALAALARVNEGVETGWGVVGGLCFVSRSTGLARCCGSVARTAKIAGSGTPACGEFLFIGGARRAL